MQYGQGTNPDVAGLRVTTIVADFERQYMAADRRVTLNDGEVLGTVPTKILKVELGGDKYLVGLAGLEGPGTMFMEWFEHGDWDEPPDPIYDIEEDDDFSVLILAEDGMWVVDKFMRMLRLHDRWYAVGTGGVAAWAVLKAGCGIQKAMETAIAMDSGSGNGYDVVFLDGTEEIY
jgi:ATP-dependent protease HslVU (ClpYQ) peptidase subunit